MSLSNMPKDEIELLSYTDLTYIILKESKESMTTATIFKKISELLDYSEEQYMAKIGDYYTSLTIDKRFVLLENNEWDLRDHHSISLVIDDEDEEEDEIEADEDEEEADEEFEEEYEEDVEEAIDDEELEDDDEFEDLSIIGDEEIEES